MTRCEYLSVIARLLFPFDALEQINEHIATKAMESKEEEKTDDDDKNSSGSGSTNKGKLIVDGTCAPEDITFPTDLKLLNKAREESEQIIDTLHKRMLRGSKKPRTYRLKARRDFLQRSKSKRASKKAIRKGIRKQLGYLGRNLRSIAKQNDKVCLTHLDNIGFKIFYGGLDRH